MKVLLSLVMLFLTNQCFAQKQLFLTTAFGWKVNYAQMVSDKPLPAGMIHVSNWSGPSAGVGLEYKFSTHWSANLQLKVADIEMGIRKRLWVKFDSITGKYSTVKGGGELSQVGIQPVHLHLGATYYSKPLKYEKISWLLGCGIAYFRRSGGFAPDIRILSEVNQPGRSRSYGKFLDVGLREDFDRQGILLNIQTGVDFNFAPNHHLMLTLQHNQGLWNVWQYKSIYFNYINNTPHTTTYENFDVKLRTKGSYSALQLGYKYRLTGRKEKKA